MDANSEAKRQLLPNQSNPEAAYELGRWYLKQEKADSAAYFFDMASKNTGFPLAMVSSGRALLAQGKKAEAEAQNNQSSPTEGEELIKMGSPPPSGPDAAELSAVIHEQHRHLQEKTVVKEILELCPSLLAQKNAKGETPLHLAARYGHESAAMLLIAHARVGMGSDLEMGGYEASKQMLSWLKLHA